MNVRQHLSILFYLNGRKATNDGLIPIYVRVTIDGLKKEISLGCKVLAKQWDNTDNKMLPANLATNDINRKITQTKTDNNDIQRVQPASPVDGGRILGEKHWCYRQKGNSMKRPVSRACSRSMILRSE